MVAQFYEVTYSTFFKEPTLPSQPQNMEVYFINLTIIGKALFPHLPGSTVPLMMHHVRSHTEGYLFDRTMDIQPTRSL